MVWKNRPGVGCDIMLDLLKVKWQRREAHCTESFGGSLLRVQKVKWLGRFSALGNNQTLFCKHSEIIGGWHDEVAPLSSFEMARSEAGCPGACRHSGSGGCH